MNTSIKKTKSPDVLVLSFENIKYVAENNLKYLEVDQLNLIIYIEINSITSNFSY